MLAHATGLLQPVVEQFFVSVRSDQLDDRLRGAYPLIVDDQADLGPAGGLLAAHRRFDDVAWIVVAVDMPGLDAPTIRDLVESRNARRAATAYRSPIDGCVEPLCAIYEPATLARFAQQAAAGHDLSPRRLLSDSDVEFVALTREGALANINTPADLKRQDD